MEPIISPWLIYIISMVSPLKCFFTMSASVISIVLLFYFIGEVKWKYIKQLIIVDMISIFLALVLPTKETLIAMLVASYTTPDNLALTNEVIKTNLQDYIKIITDGIKQVK